MSAAAAIALNLDLKKTEDCLSITLHFGMGLGRLRQIKNVKVMTPTEVNASHTPDGTNEPATLIEAGTLVTTTKASELRHQKRLMDCPELEEIRSQDGFLKRYVESKSCRYRESTRFLPRVYLREVDKTLVAYQTIRRPQLVEKFMKVYRELEAADFAPIREALGDNFERSDYPPAREVEQGFYLEFNYREVGNVHIHGVSDVILAREQEKERAQRAEAIAEWRNAMRFAGVQVVDALFEMLKPSDDGKPKKMYGCHVENLQEFITTFPDRDLANDVEFKKNMDIIKNAMKGVTVDKLKENDGLKNYILKKLEVVKADLKTMVIEAPSRRFR